MRLTPDPASKAEPTRPIDWVTPSTIPVTAWVPPRTATVTGNAVIANSVSWCSPIANPTIRREVRSGTEPR